MFFVGSGYINLIGLKEYAIFLSESVLFYNCHSMDAVFIEFSAHHFNSFVYEAVRWSILQYNWGRI
jgi:hypothetical protein